MKSIIRYGAVCVAAIMVIALVVIFTGGIGNIGTDSEQRQIAQKQPGETENSSRYKSNSIFTGDQSQSVEVSEGRIKFNLSYTGDSRFTATLLNPDGTLNKVITNAVGPYSSDVSISINETRPCLLVVKTTGVWSLSQN